MNNNLVDFIVSYKRKHYNSKDYKNGILINYCSIKHNYDFAKFVYVENIKQYKNDTKKKYLYKNKIEQLGLLVEIDYELLKEYLEFF
jgi:hypothetical protein